MPTERSKRQIPRIEAALEAASRETFARMGEDRKRVSDADQLRLFDYVQEHLFDAALSILTARRVLGLAPSVSAKLGHRLETTLVAYIRKLRIATARRMLPDVFPPG